MTDGFAAICSDFYINQKLSVKMDLPSGRETVLDLFERLRKQFPAMQQFRRYEGELALETAANERPHRWLAVRSSNIRSGVVNPSSQEESYALHRGVLQTAPYFLSISPLDIEYLELLYGFDLAAAGDHDELVFDTLMGGSPLSCLSEFGGATITDCQPLLGVRFGEDRRSEASVEIKTRSGRSTESEGAEGAEQGEPLSVYLTVRRYGPFEDLNDLPGVVDRLAGDAEAIASDLVIPRVISPLRNAAGGAAG